MVFQSLVALVARAFSGAWERWPKVVGKVPWSQVVVVVRSVHAALTFRKKEVTTDDILAALDEARAKATHSPTQSEFTPGNSKSN